VCSSGWVKDRREVYRDPAAVRALRLQALQLVRTAAAVMASASIGLRYEQEKHGALMCRYDAVRADRQSSRVAYSRVGSAGVLSRPWTDPC